MNPIMKGLNMGQPQQPMQTPEQALTQTPQQAPTQQYDFSGWGDRLNKIEEGIAGLTNQFNSFQKPGDVAPEYTGNQAPEPLPGPGIIDPNSNFSPYQRNENLDLTDRSGIMGEYSNWRMGGHGSRHQTMDMRGGFSFMGQDMAPGSSTGFGDFRKFLNTFGIGDRLQNNELHTRLATNKTNNIDTTTMPSGGQGITSLAPLNTNPGI